MTVSSPNIKMNLAPASRIRVTGKRRTRSRRDLRVPLTENALLGTLSSRYRIEKLIGVGSFSLVYSAVDIGSKMSVVIKEYFPRRYAKRESDSEIISFRGNRQSAFFEGVKRFYNEALVLKKVSHPNVLDVHDLVRANSTTYMVSLNKGGRDLKWFLSSFSGPLEQNLIYKVFMPILSALHFLHDSQLLHLDIKPANILLQPNSKSLLLDFGAAQTIDKAKRPTHKRIVTHGFAPPEQYRKNGNLGPWSDIYAIAATLYFCITGRSPANSKDRKNPSRLDVERYSSDYNASLLHAVNRALSYEISERFDSVDEFSIALLEGAPWSSLVDYEAEVMAYDRYAFSTMHAQDQLVGYAA